MLKKVDPLKDNLADNEEIQELYRSSMTLRPKIVKLIDRYSQKRGAPVSDQGNESVDSLYVAMQLICWR